MLTGHVGTSLNEVDDKVVRVEENGNSDGKGEIILDNRIIHCQ